MKNLILLIVPVFFFLSSKTQTMPGDAVKKFIDYDNSVIALRHALLIDGTGKNPKPGQTVIIKNKKIDWVGNDDDALIPVKAQIVDLSGKALLPGLVMLHEHMYMSSFANDPMFL